MNRPEEVELIKYFDWIEWVGHLKDSRLKTAYHIQNEGKWSPVRRKQLKRAGVRAGVPDVLVPIARYPHHSLYLEFKIKPNTLTPSQINYQKALTECGHLCLVSWSADEAIQQTLDYLDGKYI